MLVAFKGKGFTVERGVMQGDPQPPSLFNVVVDTMIRHRLSGVYGSQVKERDLGVAISAKGAIFYAGNGWFLARDKAWLQGGSDKLIGCFEWVGMQMNATKTKAMVCNPRYLMGQEPKRSYSCHMTSVGGLFREWQVACPECDMEISQGSLQARLLT